MTATRVLRFARSDDESSFVLLQVTPRGSKPLDLKLVGTEGEAPYVTSCKSSYSQFQIPLDSSATPLPSPPHNNAICHPLKHDRVSSLRVKNCPTTETEWQSILESLLNLEPLPDIQATATVQSETSISITIRKQIQGITQRLGAITLNYDADEAIELFEWCGAAVDASAAGNQAVADLKVKSNDAEAAVAQLKSQLEELIEAKEEDETAMLRKFRDLLNEKKTKIRKQQVVIAASGSFNASHPGTSQPTEEVTVKQEKPAKKPPAKSTRQVGKSRASKRKAPASQRVEEESEEGVQPMDVDEVRPEEQDTDPGNTTEGTASATSDDEDVDTTARPGPGAQAAPTVSEPREKTPPKAAKEQPPAPRSLPFGNKRPTRANPAPAPIAGSETDSDDEL